ncbi:Dabb family protein [Endothiovibrio diazotrophicus]
MPPADQARLHHVVLCWLKEPGNAAQRQAIMAASERFRSIPGVLDVQLGEPVASERKIVDDSFDVAVDVSFADRRGLETYLTHPIHLQARRVVLQPLVERVVIYDFEDRR